MVLDYVQIESWSLLEPTVYQYIHRINSPKRLPSGRSEMRVRKNSASKMRPVLDTGGAWILDVNNYTTQIEHESWCSETSIAYYIYHKYP